MNEDKDIIKELRHAEKLGLFESRSQMVDSDSFVDMKPNKEVDEFHSTGFLQNDSSHFDLSNCNVDMIFSSIPVSMVLKNPEGVYTVVNDFFCEWVGRKKKDIIGKTDFDLFSEELAKKFFDADARVLANGRRENQIEKCSDS